MLDSITQTVRRLLGGMPPLEPLEPLLEDPQILGYLQHAYDKYAALTVAMRAKAGEIGTAPNERIKTIGGFTILRELGRGAMGAVYLARQKEEDAPVVIKVPFSEFAAPKWIEIFFREFQALSTVRHDNIVRVFRFGKDETHNVYYYVAEFVDGVTLKELIDAHPGLALTAGEVAAFSMAVLRAVRFLRDRNVSHRDLKPGNIMFTQDGIVKLIDFGAAKIAGTGSELSNMGVVMGTFDYMAPEAGLAGAKDVDPTGPERDVYAVGIMHYRLLKQKLPTDFGDGSAASLKFARFVDSGERPLKDVAGLDALTKGLLTQMTDPDPKARLVDFDQIEVRLLQIIRAEAETAAAAAVLAKAQAAEEEEQSGIDGPARPDDDQNV